MGTTSSVSCFPKPNEKRILWPGLTGFLQIRVATVLGTRFPADIRFLFPWIYAKRPEVTGSRAKTDSPRYYICDGIQFKVNRIRFEEITYNEDKIDRSKQQRHGPGTLVTPRKNFISERYRLWFNVTRFSPLDNFFRPWKLRQRNRLQRVGLHPRHENKNYTVTERKITGRLMYSFLIRRNRWRE